MSESEQPNDGTSRARRPSRAAAVTALAALVGFAGLAGCSKSSDPPAPAGLNTALPGNRGASCIDPKGDISGDADTLGGHLSEPAGIDLVSAKATFTDSTLQVEFNTAGTIQGTPQPEFILDQGDAGQAGSWELKARIDQAGSWQLVLATWQKNSLGNLQEVPGKVISTPVNVSGSKLSYEVSQKDLPPAASYVWLFGATSGTEPTTLIDNCDNAGGGSSGTSTPGSTASSTPPTTASVGSLRQTQTTKRGETVTVYTVESPPTSPQAGATPPDPKPDQLPGDPTPVPFKLAVIDAKVCAPADSAVQTGNRFWVRDQDGNNWPVHPVDKSAHEPALPAIGMNLQPNECKQGWVTVQMPETSTPTQVLYAIDSDGRDSLLWNV